MKLNALRKVGALSAVSAISLGYAVAGPMTPAPVVDSGTVPPPPPIDSGGGLWDSVGATLSVGVDSDYIFRGVDLGQNYVWSQLDLSVPIGETVELALGAWYTSAFNDEENELDLYASLGFDFGAWGLEVGYTHYDYPNGWLGDGSSNGGETNEAYISAGTTLWALDLAIAYYYDFDLEVHYVEATAATTFELTPYVSLDPSIGVSYIDLDDSGVSDDSGWNHFFARLELPIALTESATLTPYIATSVALDYLEDDAGENDYFYGGVSLSVDF